MPSVVEPRRSPAGHGTTRKLDYLDGLTLLAYSEGAAAGQRSVTVTTPAGTRADFTVRYSAGGVQADGTVDSGWALQLTRSGAIAQAIGGRARLM